MEKSKPKPNYDPMNIMSHKYSNNKLTFEKNTQILLKYLSSPEYFKINENYKNIESNTNNTNSREVKIGNCTYIYTNKQEKNMNTPQNIPTQNMEDMMDYEAPDK